MKSIIPLTMLALALGVNAQQPPDRATESGSLPWRLTDDQRLAARVSPSARAARVFAARQPVAQRAKLSDVEAPTPTLAAEVTDIIDGRVHPELFLPVELINDLIIFGEWTTPADQGGLLPSTLGRWREYGLSQDPEPLVRASLQAAIVINRKRHDDHMSGRTPVGGDSRYCAAVADGLRQIREALTPQEDDAFMRLLYDTLARGRIQQFTDSPEEAHAMLLAKVRGCR